MMHINEQIENVEGFRHAYNDFMQRLMTQYKKAGDLDTVFALNVGLVIRTIPFNRSATGVRVQLRAMDGARGEFVLDCVNEQLRPHFEAFLREYQWRWGDTVQATDAVDKTQRQEANLSGKDKRRYAICLEAIKAKQGNGTTFADFIAQHSGSDSDYPTTTRTLTRWCKNFGLTWK